MASGDNHYDDDDDDDDGHEGSNHTPYYSISVQGIRGCGHCYSELEDMV